MFPDKNSFNLFVITRGHESYRKASVSCLPCCHVGMFLIMQRPRLVLLNLNVSINPKYNHFKTKRNFVIISPFQFPNFSEWSNNHQSSVCALLQRITFISFKSSGRARETTQRQSPLLSSKFAFRRREANHTKGSPSCSIWANATTTQVGG